MTDDLIIEKAFLQAVDSTAASNSLSHWQSVCKVEKWSFPIDHLSELIKIFGISWYFTRFIFYRGKAILPVFTIGLNLDEDLKKLEKEVMLAAKDDFETAFEVLYLLKNEIMLKIVLADLRDEYDQIQVERALSLLAERVLSVVMELCDLPLFQNPIIMILAMGRFAGMEMNYGSDLDLIFIYMGHSPSEFEKINKLIRRALRVISTVSAQGVLYDIDMRLRPHGNAGTLISLEGAFISYHQKNREIWERQMMTRCRPLNLAGFQHNYLLKKLQDCTYKSYDKSILRTEIKAVRMQVEKELGQPKDKFDIKRGTGGIMDLDFISHYLQLGYSHEYPSLMTCSTREVFSLAADLCILDKNKSDILTKNYNFLKNIEKYIRIFDMRAVSEFPNQIEKMQNLPKAMGFNLENGAQDTIAFKQHYLATCTENREIFLDILADNS